MQTQMQVAGGGGKCSGHGPARQYHLQHEQLRRRAGRPGLHSASVVQRWPSRFASTPWFSPPYRIVTRRGCAPNKRRDGQKSATTACAGLMPSSTWECGGVGRRRANREPQPDEKHIPRRAWSGRGGRGRFGAAAMPWASGQASSQVIRLAHPTRLISRARCGSCLRAVGFGSAGFPLLSFIGLS